MLILNAVHAHSSNSHSSGSVEHLYRWQHLTRYVAPSRGTNQEFDSKARKSQPASNQKRPVSTGFSEPFIIQQQRHYSLLWKQHVNAYRYGVLTGSMFAFGSDHCTNCQTHLQIHEYELTWQPLESSIRLFLLLLLSVQSVFS